jgi:hypothetical protein
MALQSAYWRTRFARWPARSPARDGYTLLIPTPGDLPVMLEVAMAVCRLQASAHRVETLVVADRPSPLIEQIVAAARPSWPGELTLLPLPKPERWMLPRLNNGWRNHQVQVFTGVAASSATHLLLHDADLFMFADDFLDRRYEECSRRHLACLGVQPVTWDEFYARHGRQLAATWELCTSIDWMRAWPPWQHMSHESYLWEELHSFDTTLYTQALTDPSRIAVSDEGEAELVHFGYVTASYRIWQRDRGGVHDEGFTHLLIRTMIDGFSAHPAAHDHPSGAELARGLTDTSAPVTYAAAADGAAAYAGWRPRVQRALDGPWIDDAGRERAAAVLAPFDAYYA